MKLFCLLCAILCGLLCTGLSAVIIAAESESAGDAQFQTLEYRDAHGAVLRYRLLKPDYEASSQQQHPLLVFLHGAGERGSDNQAQLKWGREMMIAAAQKYKGFVLAPQCPTNEKWSNVDWSKSADKLPQDAAAPMRLTMEVVAKLKKEYRIDPDRVYVMGLSMGGYGTWDAIVRWPDAFAAAVPICGGGDETKADRIKCPVWAFHGGKDTVVPVNRSRNMIEAMKAAGKEPKYTEYPEVGHDSWVPAFKDPEMLKWLFAQKRSSAE